MDTFTSQCNFFHCYAVCGINFVKISFLPQRVGGPRLRTEGGTIGDRVFSKCTRMAIMPILASEALFRENKKISYKMQKVAPLDL